MENKRLKGSNAENIACEYLLKQGYTIIQKNFYCRFGEIDIIAKDNEYLVFIEVKYRLNDKKGLPREAVNWRKQRNIIKVAKFYLQKNYLVNLSCRFDVVEMLGQMENIEINIIKNAFTA